MATERSNCPTCDAAVYYSENATWFKCDNCDERLYLKRAPDEDERHPVVKERRDEIDRQWKKINRKRHIKKESERVGGSPRMFHLMKRRIREAGGDDSDEAVFASMARETIQRIDDRHERKMLFHRIANLHVNQGKPFHEYLRRSHREKLLELKEEELLDITEVEADADHCCDVCAEMHGEVFNIDDALREQPLPHPNCTRRIEFDDHVEGFCNCAWFPVL